MKRHINLKKKSVQSKNNNQFFIFFPFPVTYCKLKFEENMTIEWLFRWIPTTKGSGTFKFFPTVSTKSLLNYRNLYLLYSKKQSIAIILIHNKIQLLLKPTTLYPKLSLTSQLHKRIPPDMPLKNFAKYKLSNKMK